METTSLHFNRNVGMSLVLPFNYGKFKIDDIKYNPNYENRSIYFLFEVNSTHKFRTLRYDLDVDKLDNGVFKFDEYQIPDNCIKITMSILPTEFPIDFYINIDYDI